MSNVKDVADKYERIARGRDGDKVTVIVWGFNKKGKRRFYLITSSGMRPRWTFPKGSVEEGKTLEEVAIEETYEEGGMRIYRRTLTKVGEYPMPSGDIMTVFHAKVRKVLRRWPEHHERARKKVNGKTALKLIKRGGKKNAALLEGLRAAIPMIKAAH